MFYKVAIVSFPGAETVYDHLNLDELFELMCQFKNDHQECRMFRPFGNDAIGGLITNENDILTGLIVYKEEAG